ncbi:ArsR family transcriptional regulator [Halorarum halobium]|uniref:ArsR family transcriptional regulator n=1 Tax=Halorarum halobium TaxID=3075121 RepID=UPI0028B16950|nr:ArsR family transcriptional regulator [Halobaculum sp. XH14]
MKLVQPTGFEILSTLEETGRNVASNIALHTERDRNYLNTRFPQLMDYGLVEKIGPSENSGLYEITDRGKAVVRLRDKYDDTEEFEQLVESYLSDEL